MPAPRQRAAAARPKAVADICRLECGIDPHHIQQQIHSLPNPLLVPIEQARHNRHIVAYRHMRQQADLLNRVADLPAQDLGLKFVVRLSIDQDLPRVTSIRRLTMRSAVVLPQPEGPISTQISPSRTVRFKLSTARKPVGIFFDDIFEFDHAPIAFPRSLSCRALKPAVCPVMSTDFPELSSPRP